MTASSRPLMKENSTSQSAPACRNLGNGGFPNLRVLIGLFIVLAGVFLALIGLGTFSWLTASSAQAQQKHKLINIQGLSDRKSTRLNSSHRCISYAVFCL